MVNIAVMGYGTVGSGVVEVIDTNGKTDQPEDRRGTEHQVCAGPERFPGESGAGEDHP